MGQDDQRKPLRCRFGLHIWVTRKNVDARWQECGRCGKYSGKVVVASRFPPGGTGDGGGGAGLHL